MSGAGVQGLDTAGRVRSNLWTASSRGLAAAAILAGAAAAAEELGALDPPVVVVDVKRRPSDASWTPRETATLASVPGWREMRPPPRNRWGGQEDRRIAEPGYFRVREIDGRWTMIDPDGCEWYSIGLCSVSTGRTTRAAEQLARQFGGWEGWASATLALLRTNGFNTLACWSAWESLRTRPDALPYTTQLNLIGTFGRERHGA